MTLAINQMVDFILSENGSQIRDQLSVQIVDQVDQLGVDAVAFARKNVGQVRARVLPHAAVPSFCPPVGGSICSLFGSPTPGDGCCAYGCKVGSSYSSLAQPDPFLFPVAVPLLR